MVNADNLLKALGREVHAREEMREALSPGEDGEADEVPDALVHAVISEVQRPSPTRGPSLLAGPLVHSAPRRSSGTVSTENSRMRPLGRWWIGVPALAAAAGLAVFLSRASVPEQTALPLYSAELEGGVAAVRQAQPAGASEITLNPGGSLTLRLRPDERVIGDVSVKVTLVSAASSEARFVDVRSEMAASGACRVTFVVPSDLPAQGNLCAVVTRSEHVEVAVDAPTNRGAEWQRFCWTFTRASGGPGTP